LTFTEAVIRIYGHNWRKRGAACILVRYLGTVLLSDIDLGDENREKIDSRIKKIIIYSFPAYFK